MHPDRITRNRSRPRRGRTASSARSDTTSKP
jgi:hypothetical protein